MDLLMIIEYVSLQLLNQSIAEGCGWLKRFFLPKKKYKNELVKIFYETIREFEKTFPYRQKVSDKFPFYQSEIVLQVYSQYILFKKNNSMTSLKEKLTQEQNIIIPTDEEITFFYTKFIV